MPGKITVVLADDHRIFREGLRSLLGDDPAIEVVGEAANAEEVVERVLEHHPMIAVVDITMPPGMNGIQAARVLGERAPDTRVIILSMTGEEEYVYQALEAGVKGYVVKQAAAVELLTAIHGVSRGEAYLSPPIAKIVLEMHGRQNIVRNEGLTLRDKEIIRLIAEGKSNREIGEALRISIHTVDKYRQRIMKKLDVHDAVGLTRYAIANGLLK